MGKKQVSVNLSHLHSMTNSYLEYFAKYKD